MKLTAKPVIDYLRSAATSREALDALIEGLLRADAETAARAIVKLARYQHRHHMARNENIPSNPKLPTGPYVVTRFATCDLLLFVPRGLDSRLVDDATGAYGYSHVTVDVGEVDIPTGKRTMIETLPFSRVHRSFLDRYGGRNYLRIPLQNSGVDCEVFRQCILAKLGEPYDDAEALTWGKVDDPAKQVCSDLATVCLPPELQMDIARQRRAGHLSREAVSVHRWNTPGFRMYVSPNGFAAYFEAPRGKEVIKPDQLFIPERRPGRGQGEIGKLGLHLAPGGKGGLAVGLALSGLLVAWQVRRQLTNGHHLPSRTKNNGIR